MERILAPWAVVISLLTPCIPCAAHSPHDVVAEVAVSPGGERIVAQYMYPDRALLLISEDGGRSWAFTSPSMATVTLQSLHFASTDVLFAADGSSPTAFRSDDGGWDWDLSSEPDGTAVRCAWPSPTYATQPVVFAGTVAGLYRSDDGGETWNPLEGLPFAPVERVLTSIDYPSEPFMAALAGEIGFWRSDDGGEIWDMTLGYEDAIRPSAMALSPNFLDDGRVWVGCEDGAVYRSDDRGNTWSESRPEAGGIPVEQSIHDLAAVTGQTVVAITADHGVLCSTDGGHSWDLCDEGVPEQTPQQSSSWGHYRRLATPSSAGSPVALASWQGLVLSEDGENWEESCTLGPTYVRATAISPRWPTDPTIWIGSYGSGLHRSTDGGGSWHVIADDISALYEIDLAVSPEYPEHPVLLLVATRRLQRSSDGGETWDHVELPVVESLHHLVLSPDFADNGIGYGLGTTENQGTWGIARTEDGGLTWDSAWAAASDEQYQITDLAFSPSDPSGGTLYARQTQPPGISLSRDGGQSWDVIQVFDEEIAALFAVSDDGDEALLAVLEGGETWWGDATGLGSDAELHTRVLQGWRTSPPGGTTLWLSLDPPGLTRSLDLGATWERIPTAFSSPVLDLSVAAEDDADSSILASTHYGAFVTCDDGGEWHMLDPVLRYEEQACPLRYSGTGWRLLAGAFTGTRAMASQEAGDSLEITFRGSAVRWLAPARDHFGTSWVQVDDGDPIRIDQSVCVAEPAVTFEHTFDVDGWHTLAIQVSGDGDTVIDAVEVLRGDTQNGSQEIYDHVSWCADLDRTQPSAPTGGEAVDCQCARQECAMVGAAVPSAVPVLTAGVAALFWRRRARSGSR